MLSSEAQLGVAFLVDAGTFVVAVVMLSLMRRVPRVAAAPRSVRAAVREVGEGFAFVRSQPWCGGRSRPRR